MFEPQDAAVDLRSYRFRIDDKIVLVKLDRLLLLIGIEWTESRTIWQIDPIAHLVVCFPD